MLTVILIVVGAAVVVVLTLASFRPNTFRVQRSITVKAPPAAIFPMVNDFRKWPLWSPYEKLDPAMKRTFEGAESGKGAAYTWDGNKKAGAGRMEIIDSQLPGKLAMSLAFTRPFRAHNSVTFTFVQESDGTSVTWIMDGTVPFIGKVMHVLINMDKMIGKDFEAGLARLKGISEDRTD